MREAGKHHIRSNVVEEISSKMDSPCLWSDNEYRQRRDVDRRMKEQEREPFPEIIAGTTEEDLGYQLDGLTSDGYVVQQRNGIGLGATCSSAISTRD